MELIYFVQIKGQYSEVYLQTCQTSKMTIFAKIVNDF